MTANQEAFGFQPTVKLGHRRAQSTQKGIPNPLEFPRCVYRLDHAVGIDRLAFKAASAVARKEMHVEVRQ